MPKQVPLQVRHVIAKLHEDFDEHIDLSDISESTPPDQREELFLSRALTAAALRSLTGCSASDSARGVIDGFGDQGIDGLLVRPESAHLYVVQSKWSSQGKASLDQGAALKFKEGVLLLRGLDFSTFNDRFQDIAPDVEEAMSTFGMKITIVVALAGDATLPSHASKAIDDLKEDLNSIEECCDVRVFGFKQLYQMVRDSLRDPAVDVVAQIQEWGRVSEPYQAIYGRVGVNQIAEWYGEHGESLFSKNLRKSLGLTKVNRAIQETLSEDPGSFWYFNNGVTVLCERIDQTAAGVGREIKNVRLRGASVVNGAQTVRAIYNASSALADDAAASVWLRAISLEDCPGDFASRVTEATNTQNLVEARDFASLDPVQEQIKEDLALTLRKAYVVKRGEAEPNPDVGCTIVEAARALAASSSDASLVARAKQDDDSVLYETGPSNTYAVLFHPRPTAIKVWRSVELVRRTRAVIESDNNRREGRAASIADQADYLVSHIVHRTVKKASLELSDDTVWDAALTDALLAVSDIVDRVIAALDLKYGASSSPPSSFRNAERCMFIAQTVLDSLTSGGPVPSLPASYWHSVRRKGRRTNSVALIVDAGALKDGAQLEFCGASPGEGIKTDVWFLADPRRARATWVNNRSKPLIWEADGKSYSPSGLAKLILNEAGISTVAVQGPLRWKVPELGTLVEVAARVQES